MVDQVKIMIRAGNGGSGAVSFRREKYIPKGGPDGGDGGKGGNVYLETDPNLSTLQDFAHNKQYAAGDGMKGGGKKMSGAKGEDIMIKVPLGTLVKLTRLALETDEEKDVRVRGNDPLATVSGQTNSNATIGTATIITGTTEISILNTKVTPTTLIYVTPTSDTKGKVLYVKSKTEGLGFTIALAGNSDSSPSDITFNYWLEETR